MRGWVVDIWAARNYPERIDRRVASIVVSFDVIHLDCAAHSWNLEYVFGVVKQIRVLS